MDTTGPANDPDIQLGALLATARADSSIESLNTALASYGLCMPITPLQHGLTLADLVARNAGGRRQLKYGTIAHYLRAVTLQKEDGTLLRLGGPTLKRATGYNLQRVLVGGGAVYLPDMGRLREITINVRPLPPARHELFIVCDDLPAACRLAARVHQAGMAPSALALISDSCFRSVYNDEDPPTRVHKDAVLLAELEGIPAVLERQAQQLETLAEQAGAFVARSERYEDTRPYGSEWEPWEVLAEHWYSGTAPTLTVNLPRATLPSFIEQATALAQRYDLELPIWGDAGVGRLHLRLDGTARTPGEARQCAALLGHLAQQMGGALCTDQPDSKKQEVQRSRQPGVSNGQAIARKGAAPAGGTSMLLSRIHGVVGPQRLITRPADMLCYDADASIAKAKGAPLAVVLPGSTAEVSSVVHLAAEAGVPLVTRGAGSGLAGGSIPVPGALVLALTHMQRLSIDAAQQVAYAEAGVSTAEVQQAADAHGLLYAPDPSSQAVSTIGGNIACNAGGPRCLKYGVTSTYVLGLTAVLADGSIVKVGDSIAAQSPDTGLLHLLVGSEGTLAVVTEATLRLITRPATRRTALAFFDNLDNACATVESIMAAGVLPAALELMDDTSIRVVEDGMHLGLPRDAGALLLMLSDGEPEEVAWESQQLADLAQQGGARSIQLANSAEEEAGFWQARRSVSPAFARVRPNKLGEDICVPLPQIAATVRRIKAISEQYSLPIPVFGHAGDGNLHPNILFDKRDPAETARAWQAAEAIFMVALDVGGTLSGEHGIGTLKRPFLAAALGDDVLALQRKIKAQYDPQNLLNPGKVL
jgi:glycolate oxidase subunit GlcD